MNYTKTFGIMKEFLLTATEQVQTPVLLKEKENSQNRFVRFRLFSLDVFREFTVGKQALVLVGSKHFVHPNVWATLVQKLFASRGIALLFVKTFDPHLSGEAKGRAL